MNKAIDFLINFALNKIKWYIFLPLCAEREYKEGKEQERTGLFRRR